MSEILREKPNFSQNFIDAVSKVFNIDVTQEFQRPGVLDFQSDSHLGYFLIYGSELEWNNLYSNADDISMSQDLTDLLFALFGEDEVYLSPLLATIKRGLLSRFRSFE
jgi:hypothetical protein